MKRLDLISGAFWLFFSVLAAIESYRLHLGSLHRPGSGFLPFGAACVLGLLSLINLLEVLQAGKETEGEAWENPKGWPKMVFVLIALLGYALVLEKIGFMISTFFLLLLLVKVIEPQSWPKTIIFSFFGCFLSYLLFQIWLQAQLPSGILGIWGF
jgi:putative tricarboxylic transport membrane protein